MSLTKAEEKAQEIDKILRCTYPGFRGTVQIMHEDGTTLFYRNAFMVTYEGCVIVFSEHNGTYVNAIDDLLYYENINGRTKLLDEVEIVLWNKRDKIYENLYLKFIKKEFPDEKCGFKSYGFAVNEGSKGNVFSTLIVNREEAEHPHTQVTNQKGENMKKTWRYSVEFKENSTEIQEEKYELLS